MMIFVVGPSKAGKSTIIEHIRPSFSWIKYLDLDEEENRSNQGGGDEGRTYRDMERFQREEASSMGIHVIVDVGAGSLQTIKGRHFFIERGHSTIAVVPPWEIVHLRHNGRCPQEFKQTEYSEERERVYRAARFHINSSGEESIEQSTINFRRALEELLRDAGAILVET